MPCTTLWLCAALASTAGAAASAEPTAADVPAIEARLVCDRAAIAPGAEFRLGVHFRLPGGWHIYWRNPGDAGLATSITPRLPQGFQVETLAWPLPQRFETPGPIVTYGYAGEVLLWLRARAPAELKPGARVRLAASAQWLACKEACVPGAAELSLELPVAERAVAGDAALFDRWAALTPVAAAGPAPAIAATVTPPGSLSGAGSEAAVEVRWPVAPSQVEVYPAPSGSVSVEQLTSHTDAGVSRISFRVRALAGEAEARTLELVIAYTNPNEPRRGLQVAVPLP